MCSTSNFLRGRPAKKQKNISGFRGQYRDCSSTSEPSKLHDSEGNQDITIVFDDLKIQFEQEYMKAEDSDKVVHELEMDDLYDEDFGFRLAEMVRKFHQPLLPLFECLQIGLNRKGS